MSMYNLYSRFLRIYYQNHLSGFLIIIQFELIEGVPFIMFWYAFRDLKNTLDVNMVNWHVLVLT